jgi:hypothetical protein
VPTGRARIWLSAAASAAWGWPLPTGHRQAMNRSGRTRIAPSLAIWRWRTQAQRGSYRSPSRWPIRSASSGTSASAASWLATSHLFADLPDLSRRSGRPAHHLARVVSAATRTLERHPNFLRLLIVFAAQPPATADGEIQAVVRRVREHALELLRAQIAAAFGDDPQSPVTDQLARFALAAIDGAFVAGQSDRGATLEDLLQPLAPSLAASRRALLARQSRTGRQP